MVVEVIDLFAGPGGLGEGFSSYKKAGKSPFKIKVSIEKDKFAHQTLLLRSFFRQFEVTPKEYYLYLSNQMTKGELFDLFPDEAKHAEQEAMLAELGSPDFPHEQIMEHIQRQVQQPRKSIVIGGPPCQAYSLAGRSKMSKKEGFDKDPRHTLYKEYLKIIADVKPAVFVMENVKGILSSKLEGEFIFDKILEDIKCPSKVLGDSKAKPKIDETYTVHSLAKEGASRRDFLIKCEEYGIPQARHRVILLAVRNDLNLKPSVLEKSDAVSIQDVIADLPALRSGLSRTKESDTSDNWASLIKKGLRGASLRSGLGRGGSYIPHTGGPHAYREWYKDSELGGVLNHETRAHIPSDLHRYYYLASQAKITGKSPKLNDLPKELLPNHKNVGKAIKQKSLFNDRFKVQLSSKPATTITSHISKDGHYFIHYDESQCRSLTVREAARVQTFPDNYKFEGPRTAQYHQVGNAVPPLISYKISDIVHNLLEGNCANT